MGGYFINKFIDLGIHDFIENSTANEFERHIVDCIVDIYGSTELIEAYKTSDEEKFIQVIRKYNLPLNVYSNFLGFAVAYEKFKDKFINGEYNKTDLLYLIEEKVIAMYKYKSIYEKPTTEEIKKFENDLLGDFQIKKMHFNLSFDPNQTANLWNKEKNLLSSDLTLKELNPDYLSNTTYLRFGTNLEDVKQMDYRMVNELNKYINNKKDGSASSKESTKTLVKSSRNRHILTSGNGFVDVLMILSIIVTTLSSILIYIFLHIK